MADAASTSQVEAAANVEAAQQWHSKATQAAAAGDLEKAVRFMERACRLHPGNEDYSREHGRLSTRLAAGEAAPRRGAREEAPRRPPPSSGDPGTDALRQGLHDPGALLSRVHAGELNAALALSELLKDRAALPPRLRDGPAVVRALCACATKWVRSSPAAEPGFRKAYGWFYLLTGMATAWLDMYADGLELAQPTRATRDLVLKETLPCLRLLDADLPRITAVVGEGGGGAFARMAGIAQLGEGAGEMFAQMDVRNNLAALVPVLCQPWSAAAWAQLPTSARVLAQFGAEIAASAYSNPAGQSVAKMRGVCALALRTLVRAAEPLRDAVAADAPGLRGVVALARASADTDAPFLHCLSALMCVASGREAHAELLVRAGVMQVVVDALTRASRQDVHAAEMSTHTFAIGICGFVTATHHDTRALWRCGVVPPLLAKLVDGTEGEKAGAAQILKEGGVLDDVEGLRKYGADAATRARLEASARVPSPAQAALRTACALLDALGAEGRPADEAGTADDTRRRCSNPGCTTRGDGDAPLSRCSGCGQLSYCSRDCQRAHWKAHKPLCKRWQAGREGRAPPGGSAGLPPSGPPAMSKVEKGQQKAEEVMVARWLERECERLVTGALAKGIRLEQLAVFVDFEARDERGNHGRAQLLDEARGARAELLRLIGTELEPEITNSVLDGILAERRMQIEDGSWKRTFPVVTRVPMPSGGDAHIGFAGAMVPTSMARRLSLP